MKKGIPWDALLCWVALLDLVIDGVHDALAVPLRHSESAGIHLVAHLLEALVLPEQQARIRCPTHRVDDEDVGVAGWHPVEALLDFLDGGGRGGCRVGLGVAEDDASEAHRDYEHSEGKIELFLCHERSLAQAWYRPSIFAIHCNNTIKYYICQYN